MHRQQLEPRTQGQEKAGGIWTMAGSPAESHHWERQTEMKKKKEPRSCSEAMLRHLAISYKQEGTMVLSESLSRTIINWADHQSTSVERHCAKCWVPKKGFMTDYDLGPLPLYLLTPPSISMTVSPEIHLSLHFDSKSYTHLIINKYFHSLDYFKFKGFFA